MGALNPASTEEITAAYFEMQSLPFAKVLRVELSKG